MQWINTLNNFTLTGLELVYVKSEPLRHAARDVNEFMNEWMNELIN
jgi:hypothetical protein